MKQRFHHSRRQFLRLHLWPAITLIPLAFFVVTRISATRNQMTQVEAYALLTTPITTRIPLINDAFPVPTDIRERELLITASLDGPGQAPGYTHTSDFMIGTVVVAIILPESDGSADPSTEDWTSAETMVVKSKIVEGLNWWETQAQSMGVSVDFIVSDVYPKIVPTAYEPISYAGGPPSPSWACGEEDIWIDDVMKNLGYDNHSSGDYILEVRDYDNALRDAYGTDWAVTIFVVDGSEDRDGMFAETDCDGAVSPFAIAAYAYVGGPFFVMNNINDGYGTIFLNGVAGHEMGHIFGAADEVPSNHCQPEGTGPSCSYIWGYLGCSNENCGQSCALNEATCIMRSPQDSPPGSGNLANTVCVHTQYQLGWRDTDGDNLSDPIDTTPTVTLTVYPSDPTSDRTPTYIGSAEDVPFPSGNPTPTYWRLGYDDVTINDVTVEYRINGGSWHLTVPTDGAFDYSYEEFTFTPLLCENATYLIEARAVNSVGHASVIVSDTLTVSSTNTCRYVYLPIILKQ